MDEDAANLAFARVRCLRPGAHGFGDPPHVPIRTAQHESLMMRALVLSNS